MTKTERGKSIKTSISIYHIDEFIIRWRFHEFTNNICHGIGLQGQYLDSGLSKQATIQAIGRKLVVQH